MADLDPSGPNAEQIRFWNEQAGPQWVAGADRLDALLSHLGEIAMERARLPAGARVLDVGCGCGDTSLTLARRVGPAGRVLGIDISGVMLERARERAHAAAVSHVAFTQADAQTHTFPRAEFDAVFSRFGVMFFADPTAAFANLGGALRAGGQVTFVCWRPLAENPWILVPLMAAAAHVTLPPPPAPGTPGPFSLGDADRVRDILQQAGFVEVVCESLDSAMTFSATGRSLLRTGTVDST